MPSIIEVQTALQKLTNKKIIQSSTYYDIKGKPIDSYTFSTHTYYVAGKYYVDSGWTDIIPDSVGEAKYELMCNL